MPMLKNADCCLIVWGVYLDGHENNMKIRCARKITKTRCLKMHNILDTWNIIILAGV
jgi:hypothetical protein